MSLVAISEMLQQQRQFFSTGATKDIAFRITQLKTLKRAIEEQKHVILQGLKADLHKPEFEAYGAEIFVLKEINQALKNLRSWTKPKKAAITIEQFPATAYLYPEPLGVVLIISAWNYPFQLMISPLIGALAAGNCAILKPSEIAPHTSGVLAEIITKYFPPNYIAVIEGGVDTTQQLLAQKFDHIFFTGGTAVGKIVMTAAAQNLTPVTLELGGKSPCIIDADVDIEHTARRIAWGKFLNAGQTCIAPDYLLVHEKVKPALLVSLQKCLREFYGEHPKQSPDYARIINRRHFQRLVNLMSAGEICVGGETNLDELYIAPTVIDLVSWQDPIMQEEIFGPILPVIEYSEINQAIAMVNARPKPLVLYFFSRNHNLQQRVLQETSSGGVCLNDTMLQFISSSLPFGGIGDSGIGGYHGKASFDTFTHYKSVLHRSFFLDFKWRYAPYQGKFWLLKLFIG